MGRAIQDQYKLLILLLFETSKEFNFLFLSFQVGDFKSNSIGNWLTRMRKIFYIPIKEEQVIKKGD